MLKKCKEGNSKDKNVNQGFEAFIPVRGGSKSIPKKNIKQFCGYPLVYWSIKAAEECKAIDSVIVSTDDLEIRKVVESFPFKKVKVIERSEESATDHASTESVMLEFAERNLFNKIILIQATSPLITSQDIENGIAKYLSDESDSLLSVVRQKRFIWEAKGNLARPLNYNPEKRPRRQEWEGYFVENGAFYITSRESLLKSKCRLSGKISLYEMDESTYFEIDEESDWIIAEKLKMQEMGTNLNENIFNNINLLISDVDGVLTDGGMYYSSSGDEFKKFNTRDGKGIELIKNHGIKVMFLTSENIDLVRKRAEKLKVDYVYMGVKNKKEFLQNFFKENPMFSFNQTAYIGDDLNDLEGLQEALLSATPFDGCKELKSMVDYVCNLSGGQGCVREFCDYILHRRLNV